MKTPAKAGEKWETVTTRNGIGRLETTAVVGMAEKLTTPAGEFMTFPVTVDLKLNGRDASSTTCWFAPDIGWVKIMAGDTVIKELKAVKPPSKK